MEANALMQKEQGNSPENHTKGHPDDVSAIRRDQRHSKKKKEVLSRINSKSQAGRSQKDSSYELPVNSNLSHKDPSSSMCSSRDSSHTPILSGSLRAFQDRSQSSGGSKDSSHSSQGHNSSSRMDRSVCHSLIGDSPCSSSCKDFSLSRKASINGAHKDAFEQWKDDDAYTDNAANEKTHFEAAIQRCQSGQALGDDGKEYAESHPSSRRNLTIQTHEDPNAEAPPTPTVSSSKAAWSSNSFRGVSNDPTCMGNLSMQFLESKMQLQNSAETFRRVKPYRSNLISVRHDTDSEADDKEDIFNKKLNVVATKNNSPKHPEGFPPTPTEETAGAECEGGITGRLEHDVIEMRKSQEYASVRLSGKGATCHQFGLWIRRKELMCILESDGPDGLQNASMRVLTDVNPFSGSEMLKKDKTPLTSSAESSDSKMIAIRQFNRHFAEAQNEASMFGRPIFELEPRPHEDIFPVNRPTPQRLTSANLNNSFNSQKTKSSYSDSLEVNSRISLNQKRPSQKFWKKGEIIGSGTFGKVFVALNERTGKLFAIKQVLTMKCQNEKDVDEMEQEIKLMKKLDNPHIVKYLGVERGTNHLYIFLEYVPGGSIASMLLQFGVFPEHLMRIYLYQILAGVNYLHTQPKPIIHGDLKGANVLVNEHGVAKLADFGCAKQLEVMRTASFQDSQDFKGSVPWMAPEVIKQTGHGRSADIWSIGITIIEMATARHPWPQFTNNFAAMFVISSLKQVPPIPPELSDESKELLNGCLQIDQKDRMSAVQLLKTDFLKGAAEEFQKRTIERNLMRAKFVSTISGTKI